MLRGLHVTDSHPTSKRIVVPSKSPEIGIDGGKSVNGSEYCPERFVWSEVTDMDYRDSLSQALERLSDAQDKVRQANDFDPEDIWRLVKFHLAPISEQLANDFRRFSSGAWTLDIYVLEQPGFWSTWHDSSPEWHAKWAGYGASRVAEFYVPGDGSLWLAMPGCAPRAFLLDNPDPALLQEIIERATVILRKGFAGARLDRHTC